MEVGTGRRGRTLLHPFLPPRTAPERLQVLMQAQRAIAGEREVDGVLTVALMHALAFSGLQAGAGLVQMPNGERVVVRSLVGNASSAGRLSYGTVLRGPLLALYEEAIAEGRPVQRAARGEPAPDLVPGRLPTYLVLPLATGRQRVLGALLLFSSVRQPPLAPEDLEVLQTLACQVAAMLDSAQLHEQLERALDELLTLYGAGQAISSSLELPEVLSGILEMSRRLARADCCLITEPDERGELVILAEKGATPEWLSYRATPGVRLTINAVLRDGVLRPLGIPPVTGWCVGLKVRQQVIGVLEVYARGGAPRYDESYLLAGLATQAAIAIENAKLYQAVRDKEAHLQDLVERMIQHQEDDRRRVAYDIHDGLAQLMVSAHQHLQTFGLLHARQDARADQALAKGLFMLQKSIEEVRKVIAGLRPSELDDFGLVPAIQLYVQSLRDTFGWQVEVVETVGPERLPAPVEVTAYRIVQEALTNARRHGDAGRARVELRREDGLLHIVVQDWGRGFDPAGFTSHPPRQNEAGRHVGLHGMRERAHLLGGTFEVQSAPGEGTIIRVTMPIVEATEGAGSGGTAGAGLPGDRLRGSTQTGLAGGVGRESQITESKEPGAPERAAVSSGGVVGHWSVEESG